MTAMTEFEQSLELLVALGICQLSARPNNERLSRALEIVTRHLELGVSQPTISSKQLETLRAWMTRKSGSVRRP
jgi:HAMP domain-containing protein